ncbi:NAD(P)/FAD-dependent oxidoreductase [Nitrincola alkalilacustris]|uniref:NAD(P)/FAD-dependent oxidoreductase n=1 Tax=Nitrincola alkalilacustris TaxID=1571224 RepID=UPI00124EE050|nr:FAD-dependent oxidoreductase [Nitrincola alkalilacustris]
MEPSIDIAVVGAGVIGVACATRLQLAGFKVLLLDRDLPGHGCSQGNAGHFATEQVLPLASLQLLPKIPRMLLDPLGPVAIRPAYLPRITPWLLRFLWQARPSAVARGTQAISQLNHASLEAWHRLLGQISGEHHLIKKGSLLVFETEQAFKAYRTTLQQLQDQQVVTEHLSGDQARDLEPQLSHQVRQAVLFPETGHTPDPLALTQCMVQAFVQAGGQVLKEEVTQLGVSDQGCEVVTQQGRHHVPRLVLATGAWSGQWLEQLTGIRVPLDTERGYHLMFPQLRSALSIPVSSAERKFIMTPMSEGLRCAGTVEFGGLKLDPDMRRADMLRQHAAGLLPQVDLQPGQRWMGHRPSLPDSLPIIDRCGPQGRVMLAFGHQHLGLTQAAITAEIIESFACMRSAPLETSAYSLNRFGKIRR